jgi:hypothetical protein
MALNGGRLPAMCRIHPNALIAGPEFVPNSDREFADLFLRWRSATMGYHR